MNSQWQQLEQMVLPTQAEVLEQAQKESILFPNPKEITEDWIILSQRYQFLFSFFLVKKTGLDRLDVRISQQQIAPASTEQKDYYQKYDRMGLRYFYLRCCARVERLTKEKRDILEEYCRRGDEDAWRDALELVAETFQTVMAVNPKQPETIYEPRQTLHGDYQVKGKEIPLVLRSIAQFYPDGSLLSEENEERRLRIFTNIWRQVDKALTKDLGCPTKTAVEVFE